MVTALVCLLLVTMLVSSMLQSALNSRRQLRVEQHARQTQLLLQAGAERANLQLASDAKYQGETLRLSMPTNVEKREGEIVIRATNVGQDSPPRVEVVARYPLDSPHVVQRTVSFSILPPSP
jgi:type II secretory pathway component PulK